MEDRIFIESGIQKEGKPLLTLGDVLSEDKDLLKRLRLSDCTDPKKSNDNNEKKETK